MKKESGFTLIELIITIFIIAVLSAIILFSITQYINRSKDAAIQGNLSTLIPAGEVYYDHNNGNGYGRGSNGSCGLDSNSFCCSSAVSNAAAQIDSPIFCSSTQHAWASCAQEFSDSEKAYCVDSIGHKREICASDCPSSINTNYYCPELGNCQ